LDDSGSDVQQRRERLVTCFVVLHRFPRHALIGNIAAGEAEIERLRHQARRKGIRDCNEMQVQATKELAEWNSDLLTRMGIA